MLYFPDLSSGIASCAWAFATNPPPTTRRNTILQPIVVLLFILVPVVCYVCGQCRIGVPLGNRYGQKHMFVQKRILPRTFRMFSVERFFGYSPSDQIKP